MSYFETKLCNEWSFPEALKFYVDSYDDDNAALQQMKKDLLTVSKNPNYNSLTKKKATLFITKIPTPFDETDSNRTSGSLDGNNATSSQAFYMGNHSTVNNVINNNGKRAVDQDDPFNQPGGENSKFYHKLLKTYCEEESPPSKETEEEEIEEDTLDIEDDLIFQEEIVYENEENNDLSAIADSIKRWKATAEYQPIIHKQVLLYYNIIDVSLDDIPPLSRNSLDFIKSLNTTTAYSTPTQVHPLNLNFSNCHTFSLLKAHYNKNKSNLSYPVKKIIKT